MHPALALHAKQHLTNQPLTYKSFKRYHAISQLPLRSLRVSRCVAWLAVMLLLFSGCEPTGTSVENNRSSTLPAKSATGKDKVVLLLNWYPEAEHGGFYAAKVHGIFDKYNLEVEIKPGGETAPLAQELVAGRTQFAIANADDVLLFRQEDVDVVSLLAPIQQTPRCVLVRADSGIGELGKLKGLTLQANIGQAFLSYMESRGMLEGVQVVPYAGSVAQFVANKNYAIQAYNFSEPQLIEQQGVKVKTLMLSEIGFNPYASCLITLSKTATEQADLTKRMTQACREGWEKYLESPAETNAEILKQNPERMTKEALEFGATQLKPLCQTEGSAALGKMTLERWQQLVEQFSQLKLISAEKVKPQQTFVDL